MFPWERCSQNTLTLSPAVRLDSVQSHTENVGRVNRAEFPLPPFHSYGHFLGVHAVCLSHAWIVPGGASVFMLTLLRL